MALTQKQRSSLCRKLTPTLGEEDAELLMSQFDDIVTKDFVHAEIAEVRVEIAGLRVDVERGFREMQRWMVGTIIAVSGLVAAVVHTFG